MSPLLPGSWVLAPALLAIGAIAVAAVAGVLLARRRARLAARTLVYGVTVLSVLASLTSGGLHAYVALPWLAVLPLAGVWSYLLDGLFVGATRAREMRDGMLLAGLLFAMLAWACRGWGNDGLWFAFLVFMLTRGLSLGWIALRLQRRQAWIAAAAPG